jgi:hypothetical protein
MRMNKNMITLIKKRKNVKKSNDLKNRFPFVVLEISIRI